MAIKMQVDSSIFKAYDIRGVYGKNLNEDIAGAIGQAFIVVVKPESVIIGRDTRISSPALHKALIESFIESGVDVIDIGMVSSDMFYYSCALKELPGIMITASHNPKEYNGFKMVRKIPYLLSGEEGIQDIKKIVEEDKFQIKENKGRTENFNVMPLFINKMLSLANVKNFRKMKIVIDTGNGMVGPSINELFKKIPQIEIIPMYFEPDGNFPNHGGDPLKDENRKELQERVLSEKADMGFAFDTDGDRFFCIDSKGRFIPGDFMTAILSSYFLNKYPEESIVYDIRASKAVKDTIEKQGGKAIVNRVGHAYIKKRMSEENAIFAGEVSGHYYFKDFYFCDSGIAPMIYLLDYLNKENLDKIVEHYMKNYFVSGEINNKVKDAHIIMERIKEKYAPEADIILSIDGLSIENENWRFNLRTSNTEPLLRLNLEASSQELMEAKKKEVLDFIKLF